MMPEDRRDLEARKVVGVGEATTTLMPPFLHRQLGIDIVDLYREVRPTWKLGIKFDWGLPGRYSFSYRVPPQFRSGRHRDFWKGNTVALGNAYGFVEPLESTALHMVIVEIAYLIGGLQSGNRPSDRSFANEALGAHWDYLRWFLSVHYKFNRKSETRFWRDCRASVDVSGLQPLLDHYSTCGPWVESGNRRCATGDPAFNYEGLMIMLLGQQVPCPPPTRTTLSPAQWRARLQRYRALLHRALPQPEAIALLRQRPQLLRELQSSERSWINGAGERMTPTSRATGIAQPRRDDPLGRRFREGHPGAYPARRAQTTSTRTTNPKLTPLRRKWYGL